MEQEPKQKQGPGVFGLAAGAAALSLILSLALAGGRARAALAPAVLDAPRQAPAQAVEEAVSRKVIPLGKAVGIKLFSDGVLVVGLSPVETEAGSSYPGRDCGLKAGDVITHINGGEVDTIEEVQALVAQQEGEPLTIQAVRGQRQLQLTVAAVENSQGVYQLGVWLRDSMAGIGTMTFYDPSSGVFGALGHGINDVDTAMLMPLESGSIMPATVDQVKKGASGQPGELHGQFDLTRDLGTLYANTNLGIFGQMPRETVGRLARAGKKKVGILGTDGTIQAGGYQRECDAQGLEAASPPPEVQRLVMRIIYEEIKRGEKGSREKFAVIDRWLRESGCDGGILACTELSVYRTYHGLPDYYTDAMDVLAETCILACGYKLRTV